MPATASEERKGRVFYVGALVLVTLLWGSSFPAIKAVMWEVNEYRYVWMRSLFALLGLAPIALLRAAGSRGEWRRWARGGLAAGVLYLLGIWLQGWGTAYTTASNSAFITGLNVVFVHAYQAVVMRKYGAGLAASLALSTTGLYLLTSPTTSPNIGDLLVLASSVAWAAQVVVVSRYSGSDPAVFTFFEALPSLAMIVPDALLYPPLGLPGPRALALLAYLGLACTDAAFALQVYGQRGVTPATAATIYILEPVVAAALSWAALGETMPPQRMAGAALILASMYTAVREEARRTP